MIDERQIDEWKRAYGRVFCYTARKDGCADKKAYFRGISPAVLDAYESASKRSKLAGDDIIIDNCWLGGDAEMKEQDDYKMGLRDWLGYLLVKVEGEMAEL